MKSYELLLNCNVRAELARRNLIDFVAYIKPTYQFKDFHKYIISRLEAFERGEIKKLMIFMPPQHGKSELTSRLFPAYLLGKQPKKKIVISSYSATIAHEFARDVKNNIISPEFKEVFSTKIGKLKELDGSYSDSSYYYHTAPEKGFIYAVGRGGSITSKTVDIGIIDDPLKGREEAMSLGTKEKLYRWYIDDYRTRMHNDSQELLIQTRWDQDDLAGRLLKEEAEKWEVICFPAIKTEDFSEYDKRNVGEPLYPEKHSLERILDIKKKNEVTFNSLYQQDPKPNESIMVHPGFIGIEKIPYESIEKWIIGIDYGYTNDPTAIVAIGVWNNKRYWKRLAYNKESSGDRTMANISPENILEILKMNNMEQKAIYSEHDKNMISGLRRLGLGVSLANKSINAGIMYVNEQENYYEASDMIMKNEITKYQFQTIGEVILNTPVDGNDHLMNAGRYAIFSDKFR